MRPPLTARLRRSHWIVLDGLMAVPIALVLAVSLWTGYHRSAHLLPELVLVVLLAALGAVPVAIRRIWPLPALGVLLGLFLIVGAFQFQTAEGAVMVVPAAYVLYTVAVTYRRPVSAAALTCALAVMILEVYLDGRVWGRPAAMGNLVPLGLLLVIAWAFGSMARQRRAYASGLQQQAASQAVAEERLRIARELHDVVAHSMAVIAVQAGFGQYVIGSQPAQAREALGAIQTTSRDALDEMRRMLSVLRQAETDGPPEAPRAPADGLAGLDRLITRVGHAGVHVDLEISGQQVDLPASVDLSAFRIIQEALTNVVKHAATPDCRVRLDYREQELSLEILDEGQAPAPAGTTAGHGLIGMRERVHLCGGEFSAGPLPEHGFRVAAALPLNREPA